MYILSKKTENSAKIRPTIWIVVLLLLLAFPLAVQGQFSPVRVNVAIMPPYSTKLSDYTNNPNKVLVTLHNFSVDGVTLNVYLRGELTGQSGTRIYTSPNYKPASPIVLQPGIPYTLTVSNIQDIFSSSQLVYEGISENEILYGNGLPEDNYIICLKAYGYQNDMVLSDDAPFGCSTVFSVGNIEPPFITAPWCHEELTILSPQNIIFSWTRPAGAPINVQYRLKIVEVSPPGHDINNAFNSAAHPIFFETVVTTNTFLFGPAQPALVQGKTYAFAVTAFDPIGNIAFRNGGRSEICSFKYGSDPIMQLPIAQEQFYPPNLLPEDFEFALPTRISGKLMAKYPTSPHDPIDLNNIPGQGQGNFPATPISIPSGSTTSGTSALTSTGVGGNWGFSFNAINQIASTQSNNINIHQISNGAVIPGESYEAMPGLEELFQRGMPMITQMNARKYIFENTQTLTHTKPLANVTIRLVARIAAMSDDFGVEFPEYGTNGPLVHGIDLNRKYRGDGRKYANVIIYETTTDESGNYTFDFSQHFWTGPIFIQQLEHEAIAVENQNPFADIFDAVVFPGANLQNIQSGIQGLGTNAVSTPGQQSQQVMRMGGALMTEGVFGYLCLKIEIVNEKFASPDIDIFAMPGDNIQLPVQMARLKTYNMIVEVKSDDTPDQINTPNTGIKGVRVSILRDQEKVGQEIPQIIDYEGQRLDSRTFVNYKEYKNVCIDTTETNGKVVFYNLVRHAYINPQYFIDVTARDAELMNTDYENTFFNYQNRFENLPDDGVGAMQNFLGWVTYNHQYTIPTITRVYKLKPLHPEIKGRAMAMSNLENVGLPGVTVTLLNQVDDQVINSFPGFLIKCSKQESSVPGLENGFFRFPNLPVKDANGNHIYRRIMVKHPLYKVRIFPPIGSAAETGQKPYKLVMGELVDLKDVNLEPLSMMEGYVEDEEGKPVIAYVRSGQSPYYKTEPKVIQYNPLNPAASVVRQVFTVPAQPLANVELEVKPLSSQYFPLDTTFYPPEGMARIKVYRRLHRPVVTVRNPQGQAIQGATVNIGGFEATTDAQGKARLQFAAAADQFILKITPPAGYAPLQEPVQIPVTPLWNELPTYTLKRAKSIHGHVTAQGTSEPVEGALVFAELVNTDGMPLYIEATTNAQGYYMLLGIPNDLTQLIVQVIKEGNNPSYIGTTQTVSYPNTNPIGPMTQNFTIRPLTGWDFSSIWGFPIAVTSFTEKIFPGNTYPSIILNGYFISPKPTDAFSLLQPDLKIPFRNLYVSKGANNRPEPVNESLETEALEIPLRVGPHYTGTLYNYGISQFYGSMPKKKLIIDKVTLMGGGGKMEGQVKLDLASFEISHQFSGQLFIGMDTLSGKATVFNSSIPFINQGTRYQVFSINNQLRTRPIRNYKVFNFEASAILSNSYLENGIIRLQTILHTQIPGGGPNQTLDLKIPVGYLVINNTDINVEETPGGELSFDLEKWKVNTTKPWRFDINEDAIVLEEVLIITGRGVDARVKNMRVRPKSLNEGQIDLQGGLTLGGVANLELSGTLEPMFNFDEGIGHYRISLVGSTNTAAGRVRNLEHTDPPEIRFESIGILSNQTEAITINQTLRFFNIVDVPVQSIMTGPGFFSLKGRPELGIPGYSPPNAIINFTKVKNKLVPKIEPLQDVVRAHGNVDFALMQDTARQVFAPNLFTTYGDLYIKPAPDESGAPVRFTGFLTKTPTSCNIEIIKVDSRDFKGNNMQWMPAGKNKMPVEGGIMSVIGERWDTLTYQAYTRNITGLNDKLLDFKVYGLIDVSGESISVSNINTPLGNLSMTYNFAEGSLLGKLGVKFLNLGYATIYDGDATVRFDKYGYYFLLDLKHFGLGPGGGMPGFKGALLVGASDVIQEMDLFRVRANFKHNLPAFNNFAGLYVIGEKELFNSNIPFSPLLDVSAEAGLGMFVNVDFGSSNYGIGGYGYAWITGTKNLSPLGDYGPSCLVGGRGSLWFDIQGGYENGEFKINTCGAGSVNAILEGLCKPVFDALQVSYLLEQFSNLVSVKVESEFNISALKWDLSIEAFKNCPQTNPH